MKLVLLAIVILLLATGSYFLFSPGNASPITSPAPSSSTQTPSLSPTIDTSTLKAGGSSFADPKGVYVFLYPSDYRLDENDPQHIRIFKTGATQKGQTEMYDGVIMVFETVTLENQTLDAWVSKRIQETTLDGTVKIIKPKTATTVNGYPGFTYTTQGLGSADYLVLQKDAASPYAVFVTTSVMDPKQVGFQTEVTTVLATLQLLK